MEEDQMGGEFDIYMWGKERLAQDFVGEIQNKGPLICGDNIKMDLKEMRRLGLDSCGVGQTIGGSF
jgi:hypothetical protein